MTEPNPPATPPAGWHPDPWVAGQRRYWTGSRWTSDTFPDSGAAARWGQAARPEAGAYGPPPTSPASPPPPPPAWGTAAPAAERPVAAPVPAVPPEARPRWPLWVVGGAAAAIVLAALAAVLLLRDPSPAPGTAAAATTSPTPSPTQPAPSASPPTGGATPSPAPTSPASPPSPGPSGSPGAPATPGQPGGSTAALLANLVVRQRDVPAGFLVATIDGGDQVAGQTTLDLCDATYPSESLRTDRLQTVAVDVTGDPRLSTEAVAYRSAAATAQAFDELRAAAVRCAATSRDTSVTPNADASWGRTAGVDRLAFRYTRTDASGDRTTGLAVYLKRGEVFLGLYFPDADRTPMPVEGRTTVPEIVQLFEERLLRGGASSSGTGSGGVGA